MVQVDNMPHLRLAPPAVYHEKVKKGVAMPMLRGESSSSSSGPAKIEKTKTKAVRFPLKSNIFGNILYIEEFSLNLEF